MLGQCSETDPSLEIPTKCNSVLLIQSMLPTTSTFCGPVSCKRHGLQTHQQMQCRLQTWAAEVGSKALQQHGNFAQTQHFNTIWSMSKAILVHFLCRLASPPAPKQAAIRQARKSNVWHDCNKMGALASVESAHSCSEIVCSA